MRISDWSSDVCSSDLPVPELPAIDNPYGILVTGIGGTGVVTIGSLLGMAAHLENKGVTVLDMAGLAQKGDRKSVVKGKSVSVRVDLGGRRIIKKKKKKNNRERLTLKITKRRIN